MLYTCCCSIVIILLSLLFILFSLRLIDFSHVYMHFLNILVDQQEGYVESYLNIFSVLTILYHDITWCQAYKDYYFVEEPHLPFKVLADSTSWINWSHLDLKEISGMVGKCGINILSLS